MKMNTYLIQYIHPSTQTAFCHVLKGLEQAMSFVLKMGAKGFTQFETIKIN